MIGRALEGFHAYKFARLLTQPYRSTKAYRRGAVDEKGTVTGRLELFERIAFKIRSLADRFPGGSRAVFGLSAAAWLLSEEGTRLAVPDDMVAESSPSGACVGDTVVFRVGVTPDFDFVENGSGSVVESRGGFLVLETDSGAVVASDHSENVSGNIEVPERALGKGRRRKIRRTDSTPEADAG